MAPRLPGAATALAARAVYREARGWDVRGTRWARDTPNAAFAEMTRWLELAAS